MKPASTGDRDTTFQDLVARVRASKAFEARAIAEGKSDIVADEPLTAADRGEMGLDRYFGDEGAEARIAAGHGEATNRP